MFFTYIFLPSISTTPERFHGNGLYTTKEFFLHVTFVAKEYRFDWVIP